MLDPDKYIFRNEDGERIGSIEECGETVGGTFKLPEKSEYTLHCANMAYNPDKGCEPNRFHRFMQKLILGFEWKKS